MNSPAGRISNPGRNVLHALLATHHFHEPAGLNDFDDPATWDRASYTPDLFAELGEPLPEAPNGYRAAALYHLGIMFAVDEFCTAVPDPRLAVVSVAIVLQWPSVRGLTVPEIAEQLGCTTATLTRSIARFKTMAGLGVSAGGGVRFIGNGAGSGHDKSAAVRA